MSERKEPGDHHRSKLRTLLAGGAAGVVGASEEPAVVPAVVRTVDFAPKPTIVLVHGAFADSSSWTPVIRVLREQGFPVIAVPNHLRSLAGDAASVRSVLAGIAGPVVLVGHSYGGAVISNAAVGLSDVKALVYIAAFIPAEGESIGSILSETPGTLLGPDTTWSVPFEDASAPEGVNTDVFIDPDHFAEVFAADVRGDLVADLAATQRPLAATAQDGISGPPAWHAIPSWALITLEDKALPPTAQKAMAARAGSYVETVHSSHAVMVSHPQAVVNIVLDAAQRSSAV